MKHILLHLPLTIALAAILPACSDTDRADTPSPYDAPGTYITFAPPVIDLSASVGDFADPRPSRSILATSVDKFRVWGFCVPDKASTTGAVSPDEDSAPLVWNRKSKAFTSGADLNHLKGDEVTFADGFTTYNNGNLTSWVTRLGASHSFIAATDVVTPGHPRATFSMAPADASSTSGHGPRLTVTLPATGTTSATPLDYNAQPDIMVAAKFDHEGTDGRVPLSFFHIMTGIRFKFNNHSDLPLHIHRVTYSGKFFREALFDFTTDKPVMTVDTTKTYSGTFTLLSTRQDINVSGSVYMGGDTDPVTLLLLPNPDGTTDPDGKFVLGRNKVISIEYSLGDNPLHTTFTLSDNFTLNYLPQSNTLHTAYFNFVGDGFVIAFQADDSLNWQDGNLGGSSDITIK